MTDSEFAFRAMWVEHRRPGPKAEPQPYTFAGNLWSYPSRQRDPVEGVDAATIVRMARAHYERLFAEHGGLFSEIEVVAETRRVDHDREVVQPRGSWSEIATIHGGDDGAQTTYAPIDMSGNPEQVRAAMSVLTPDREEF